MSGILGNLLTRMPRRPLSSGFRLTRYPVLTASPFLTSNTRIRYISAESIPGMTLRLKELASELAAWIPSKECQFAFSTALQSAKELGGIESEESLLNEEITLDGEKTTLLILLTTHFHETDNAREIAKQLIELGADPQEIIAENSALSLAEQTECHELTDLYRSSRYHRIMSLVDRSFTAAATGNLKSIKYLLMKLQEANEITVSKFQGASDLPFNKYQAVPDLTFLKQLAEKSGNPELIKFLNSPEATDLLNTAKARSSTPCFEQAENSNQEEPTTDLVVE